MDPPGGVAERSNAPVLKTGVRSRGPRVRIPPPPLGTGDRNGAAGRELSYMLSALMMLRRVLPAFRYAVHEEEFLNILSAGVLLVVVGTLTYALGQSWNVVDAVYFSVSILTTTSVADPDLVLTDGWLKIFTILYQLVGIGILVEILRRLGLAFIIVRRDEKQEQG